MIDLTGKRFGMLLAVAPHDKDKFGRWRWFVVCDCGGTSICQSGNLTQGTSKSCGCKKRMTGTYVKDLVGKKFNKLTALRRDASRMANGKVYWECLCDCGEVISVFTGHLQNGHTKSCGCIQSPKSNSAKIARWRAAVLVSYGFKCLKCGSADLQLEAHHIRSFTKYPELRYELDNGACLCRTCHRGFHDKYGSLSPMERELEEWIGDMWERTDNDFVREEVSRLLDFSRPYSARNTYRKKEAN